MYWITMGTSIVIWIALILETSTFSLRFYDKCPGTTNCGCSNDSDAPGGIVISCKDATDDDLLKLPLENMTRIIIRESTLKNHTNIGILRKSTMRRLKNISIFDTIISHFYWQYMPELIGTLTLGYTRTKNVFSSKKKKPDGTSIYECGMQHIKNMSALHLLRQELMKSIPPCLPPTIKRLSVSFSDLSSFSKDVDDDGRTAVLWPKCLTILSLSNNNITSLSKRVFDKSPPELRRIIFRNQPITDGMILRALPAATIVCLRLQGSPLFSVSAKSFENFRNFNILTSLAITYCKLETIPQGLPASVINLYLEDNKIKAIASSALKNLKNLKYLGMKRNLLKSVPKGLPSSLQTIELQYNNIFSCHTEAFIRMKNLTNINLSHNRLTSIPTGIPNTIEHFDLKGNRISEIGPESSYEFCANCKVFDLLDNPWACNSNMIKFVLWLSKVNVTKTLSTDISRYVKCETGMPGLNDMVLESIMSTLIKFRKLGCSYTVTVLNCTSNKMTAMPRVQNNLKKVIINNNPLPENATDYIFFDQKLLTFVQLEKIGLTRIPKGLPPSILYLNLANNKITSLSQKDAQSLKNLTNVRKINLHNNKLTTLLMNHLLPLFHLQLVDLSDNPLICNCELWPFIVWLHEKQHQERSKHVEQAHSLGSCSSPADKKGLEITMLQAYFWYEKPCVQRSCDWDMRNPELDCSYNKALEVVKNKADIIGQLPSIVRSRYWEKINLNGLGLKNLKIRLNHLNGLKDINLSNNSLNSIPLVGLPHTLVNLTLEKNNISSLPGIEGIKKHLPQLKCLNLQNNSIRTLSERDVQLFPHLTKLLLHNNPLVCDCRLRPLVAWIAANQDNPKVMRSHELEKLKCYAPTHIAGKLIANLTEQEYCPEANVGAISGGLVAGVLFLISLAVACNIYMHRKCKIREREAILQGFRELLQQEAGFDETDPETGVVLIEHTRFKYDAFVSYSPHEEDTEFAMWLLDELEVGQNYKLCVHERDFVPGMGIADNIVECIGASKRIILILSNHFITSSWCQYEVQIALTELHQKRKSKLLIPILLEELDGKVEGSVRTFLSLIKAIRIPSNQSHSQWTTFWNEVKEAMPEDPIQDEAV